MIDDNVFREEVAESLRQATDGQLARIMQFIDRLPARARLDDVVAPVRGRLALARPARSVTPARVLTAPIEDLLVDPACAAASPRALPRDILTIFHRIALDALDAGELSVLEDEAQGAVMDDAAVVAALGRRLWPAAAAALRRVATGPAPDSLTPDSPAPDGPRLLVIAELLEHAETLTAFLRRLPPQAAAETAVSGEPDVACAFLAWAIGVSETVSRCAAAMLLRRLGDPAAALALPAQCGCGALPARSAALLADAVDECLREVELTTTAVTGTVGSSPFACAEILLRQATLLQALTQAAPLSETPARTARLAAARAAAQALAIERFSLLLTGPAAARFAVVADGASDENDVAEAEALARAAAKIIAAGVVLGCGPPMIETARPWRDDLRRRLSATAARHDAPAERLRAVMDGVRLAEIVLGPEEAEALVDALTLWPPAAAAEQPSITDASN